MTRRSVPRRLATTAGALAVAALCLVGCAGRAGTSASATAPPSSSPSSPPTSAPAGSGGQYKLVDNLCDHVGTGAITKVLPYVAEEMHKLDNPVPNARNCFGTLGLSKKSNAQGSFNVLLEVFDTNAEAEAHYETFYQINVGMSSATKVDGIGQKAYQYTVPGDASQPSVRVLDSNAVVTCDWLPLDKVATPAGFVEALIETIRGTLTSLQKS